MSPVSVPVAHALRLAVLAAVCMAVAPLAHAQMEDLSLEARLAPSFDIPPEYGRSVALSGDRALVSWSAGFGPFVFVRTDTGWVEETRLMPNAVTGGFGAAVALDGDHALLGSRFEDENGEDSGAAYVFVRTDADGWAQEARLVPDDASAGARFGSAVSISGDRALVGALFEDENGDNSGAAYVFIRTDAGWTQQAKLIPADGAPEDRFGHAVALSGDRALVGAFQDDAPELDSGSAYVFSWDGSAWQQDAKLTPPESVRGDWFGWSVALDGDRALVGAKLANTAGTNSGAAYVFERTGTDWVLNATLLGQSTGQSDNFGASVALDGDRVLVGAEDARGFGEGQTGAAVLFARSGEGWIEVAELAVDIVNGAKFGQTVALSGERALVGAPEGSPESTAGSAYVFAGVPPTSGEARPDASASLSAAAPNPTSRRATLHLALDAPQHVRATLIDALGRELAILFEGAAVGTVSLAVEASALPPGVYVVRVAGDGIAETQHLTVVR